MNVTRKLILLLLCAAILPLLLGAWLAWPSAAEALERAETTRLASEARAAARDLAQLASRARTELQRFAESEQIRALLEGARAGELLRFPSIGPTFEFAVLYGADGSAVAVSEELRIAPTEPAPTALPHESVAVLEEWLRTGGENAAHFVCSMRARELALPSRKRDFCMGFVRAVPGDTRGWVYASVCWNCAVDALDDSARGMLENAARPSDLRFALISEAPLGFVGAKQPRAEPVQQLLPELVDWMASGRTGGRSTWGGEPVALGLAPIRLAKDRPEDRWWVATAQPLASSSLALRMLRGELLGALLAAVVLAVLLAAFVGTRASRRLRSLATRAADLGGRKSSAAPAETSRGDEITALATSFDRLERDLEQKRAQLRAALRRLDDLVRSTPDPLLTLDREGRLLDANPAGLALLGGALAALRGRAIATLLPTANDERSWEAACERAASSGELAHFAVRAAADSSASSFDVAVAPVRDRARRIVHVLAILRDQTERERAREAAAKQHAVLDRLYGLRERGAAVGRARFDAASELLRAELDAACAGAYLEDHGALRWIGLAASDGAEGFTACRSVEELRARAAERGLALVLERPLEDRRGERRGGVVLGRAEAASEHAEDVPLLELFARWIGVELEVERLQRSALQHEKMITVGGLAAGIAHELNNPLAAVLQNLKLLAYALDPADRLAMQRLRESGLDEASLRALGEYRERFLTRYVERIEQAGTRAAGIVADLLSFSRDGKPALQPTSTPELVRRSLALARLDVEAASAGLPMPIELVCEIEPGAEELLCDARQIEQVLLNLVQNASHALREMPENARDAGFAPRIELRVRPLAPGRVEISVSDNGPGIAVDPPERVFEPFFTTKEVGRGTGLGLYVCWFLVVEAHGGAIRVHSRAGGGARFEVELAGGARAEDRSALVGGELLA
ncbi:MAG: PAS domain-containing protein [Planctomycetes bacterium]|nr:PAS domain-containing protein [Planctomycetota bacterium]